MRHLVLIGLMGSGKTTVGRRVAAALDRPFIDSDEELRARTGMTARELQDANGRTELHDAERRILEDALSGTQPCVLAAAASVADTPGGRELLTRLAHTVWLDAPAEILAMRVDGAAADRPGELDADAMRAQRAERAEVFGSVADLTVGADRHTGTVVGCVLRWIAETAEQDGTEAEEVPAMDGTYEVVGTADHGADMAMGIELRAIELEEQLERAEVQGRTHDVHMLTVRLAAVLDELADVADAIPSAA